MGLSSAQPPEPGEARFSINRQICQAGEYDALRDRLPHRRRREVPRLPSGHLGLIVQAVTNDDYPLRTIYGSVPASGDLNLALERLERTLRRKMSEPVDRDRR